MNELEEAAITVLSLFGMLDELDDALDVLDQKLVDLPQVLHVDLELPPH